MRKKNLLSLAVLSMVLAILVPANAQSIGLQPTNDPYDLRQKVDITTALYMCFMLDADMEFETKATELADEAKTKYESYYAYADFY